MGSRTETCPTCKRWLASYHTDGSFDLAGHAGVTVAGVAVATPGDVTVRGEMPLTPVLGTAICNRWRCRVRRWLSGR
jgi:hypothetical protein